MYQTVPQIIQALGTRAGTSQAGLSKLHCNASRTQAETSTDALTELEASLALTSTEPEEELAAKAAPAAAAAAAVPAHDSAACQQQVQAATNRMWEMVAGSDELQQHLVSQLNRTEGVLASIQASHQTGTAHPMARLSRVQDTWGNSLVRKKTFGLDKGYPKSKRIKTAQQPSQPTESEAVP